MKTRIYISILLLLFVTGAQAQWKTTRVYRGPGAPGANLCANSNDLGIVYTNYQTGGRTYTCQKTSADSYAWRAATTADQYFVYGVAASNAKYVRSVKNITAAGITDFYTVPAGRRAYLTGCTVSNLMAILAHHKAVLKSGGVYYRFSMDATANANSQTVMNGLMQGLLEAGETIAVDSTDAAGAGIVVSYQILEFDNNTPVRAVRVPASQMTPNTVAALYTVPDGKTATLSSVQFTESSGAVVKPVCYAVKAGDSPTGANTIASTATAMTANQPTTLFAAVGMSAGDSFQCKVDVISATGLFVMAATELPAL